MVATLACDAWSGVADAARKISDDVAKAVDLDRPVSTYPTPTTLRPGSDVGVAVAALESLTVAERGSEIEYDRSDWRHWIDFDQDCQDTRAEVLIAESLETISFATNDRCRVTGGEWIGPWSGEAFADASDVDVDHHVPLGHAHVSGGWRWDEDRKRAYANDLTNPNSLQATSATVNRSKGKKPPDQWRPEHPAGWCRYAIDWISVKQQWELTVSQAEKHALDDMLATCNDAGSWGVEGVRSE